MAKLYEIDAAIQAAIEKAIDPETGEIVNASELDALQVERDKKIENMIGLWKNQAAEVAALKAEADNLKKRADSLNKRNDGLKKFIRFAVGDQNFKSGVHEVRFRKTPDSVKIDNEECVIEFLVMTGHEDCILQKPPEISKKNLKSLIKSGEEVPGVTLESSTTMTIM